MKPAISSARRGQQTAAARRERGVALVVTLLLLAVITFMAITFLVVSRNERGSVTTTTDLAIARLAADAALEQAKADIIMPMLAQDNPFLVGLMVSTNYINSYGFIPGLQNPTNVNFDYTAGGGALTPDQQLENLANLQFRPRVPVFMRDRQTGQSTFQYYLDINRNGLYEMTGWQPITNELNQPVLDETGQPVYGYFTGDPEWIGGTEFPNQPHSAENRFTWRFAYMVAPVGQTLDLNYMHNTARQPTSPPVTDQFARNQGVGTWEMNLAAFFTDLNTNMWYVPGGPFNGWGSGYDYRHDFSLPNAGSGFDDATALLRYRYNGAPLWDPTKLFQNADMLLVDGFDTFSGGAPDVLGTRTALSAPWAYTVDPDSAQNRRTLPWAGSYNPNLFYSPFDLFDRAKTEIGVTGLSLTDRLVEASRRPGTYDRFTFQRLLEQLGTESAPEEDRLNVNYRNAINGRIIPNAQTNFVSWEPTDFFTNAAARLLDNAGFTFGITNIQIWPTNNYTPSVHRALQLAANLYDASTNTLYPTVFRPIFGRRDLGGGTNGVFITGYRRVMNITDLGSITWRDPLNVADRDALNPQDLVWGVPFVVGAKRGLPNFNEYGMDTKLYITRKLEFRREGNSNTGNIVQTNQMFTFAMVNSLGLEAWNSYLHTNWANVRINARVEVFPSMTNRLGQVLYPTFGTNGSLVLSTNFTIGQGNWPAYQQDTVTYSTDNSLVHVITNQLLLIPESRFSESLNQFVSPPAGAFEQNGTFPVPDWFLNLRTRVYYSLVDNTTQEILDFVTLTDFQSADLAAILQQNDSRQVEDACGRIYEESGAPGAMWCTNRMSRNPFDLTVPTYGVLNQIGVSLGTITSAQWPKGTNMAGIDFFRAQFDLGTLSGAQGQYSKTNVFYAPYSPTREVHLYLKWQANDPLVHYTPGDLFDQGDPRRYDFKEPDRNIGKINKRYQPYFLGTQSVPKNGHNLALKDPLMWRSDNWDFPTNKFPNIGWIGRVHRGTPWQTVYLKSAKVSTNDWEDWAGSGIRYINKGQVKYSIVASNEVVLDSQMSLPLQDWTIPDLFTAALVDNATRGQLSINQPGLAAWSAVLAGVPVLSNITMSAQGQFLAATNIQPAAVDGALQYIVDGINRTRSERPGGVFRRLGEICSVPELTVNTPYKQYVGGGRPGDRREDVVSEAVYERIPQQVLGLLRCESTPRFVVYSYGQALKPANASVLTTGPFSGMVTNYQVTAEVATRAVIRVEGVPENPKVVVENFNVLPPE